MISLIERDQDRCTSQILLPSTEMTQDVDSIQIANPILFGLYLAESKTLPLNVVRSTHGEILKGGNKERFISINMETLRFDFKQV